MKIYDCFTFYNEFELLELRLRETSDLVDHFVIVEANTTFQNQPKELLLKQNWARFNDKEKEMIVEMMKVSAFCTVPQADSMGVPLFKNRVRTAEQGASPRMSITRDATHDPAECAEAGNAPLSDEEALRAIAEIHEAFENGEVDPGCNAPSDVHRRRSFDLLCCAEKLHRTLSDEVNLLQREYQQISALSCASPRLAVLDSDGDGVCQTVHVRPSAVGEGVLFRGTVLQQSQYRAMRADRLLDEIRQMAAETAGGLASLLT